MSHAIEWFLQPLRGADQKLDGLDLPPPCRGEQTKEAFTRWAELGPDDWRSDFFKHNWDHLAAKEKLLLAERAAMSEGGQGPRLAPITPQARSLVVNASGRTTTPRACTR